MNNAPQEEINARWEGVLDNYSSNSLTVGDIELAERIIKANEAVKIEECCHFSLQTSAADYFITPNGRTAHDVHFDGGMMQQAA